MRPIHLDLDLAHQGALLEFELAIANASDAALDGLRVSLALISANPDQDAIIAGFFGGPQGNAAGPPVDVAPGAGGTIPARLALPRELIHLVTIGARPMFMPMLLVDLRWRSGLSIRRHGAAFMVGMAGEGGKLGPIWTDRGPSRRTGLSASRYVPRPMPLAAAG
jgi:hypothetical protein